MRLGYEHAGVDSVLFPCVPNEVKEECQVHVELVAHYCCEDAQALRSKGATISRTAMASDAFPKSRDAGADFIRLNY